MTRQASGACPRSSEVARYLEGTLDGVARARLEVHLDACAACLELVATLAAMTRDPSREDGPTTEDGANDGMSGMIAGLGLLRRGEHIDRYLILEVLGAGGMGVIYSAYDPELDRRVALKLLHAARSTSASADAAERDAERDAARLTREARAMARLSHRNVIAVYDVGGFAGRVYVAMELIQGQTLGRWCAAPRSSSELVSAFLAAGRGLEAAHAAELVHRDFKPSNVMVEDNGRVVVLDFGLARALGPDVELDASELCGASPIAGATTRTGAVIGTPAYMAPEQRAGALADARSDQYSFCAALHEALYGALPGVDPLRNQTLPGATDAVPPRLRGILARGLRAAPDQRYPSMSALLEALEGALTRTRRRRRALVTALAGASVVALGGVVGASVTRPPEAPVPCQEPERRLAGVWDEGRRAEVLAALQSAGAEDSAPAVAAALDRYGAAWVAHARAACEATRVHGEQTERQLELRTTCLEGRLRRLRALTGVLAAADRPVAERAALAVAALDPLDRCADLSTLAAADAVLRSPDPELAPALDELAEVQALRDTGQYTPGLARSGPLVARLQTRGYTPALIDALLLHGELLGFTDQHARAEQALRAALWIAEEGGHDLARAEAWIELLYLRGYQQADAPEGERMARHARAVLARVGGDATLEARRLLSLGLMYSDVSRHREAAEHHGEAVRLIERTRGGDSPLLSAPLLGLANAQRDLGDFDAAEASYRRALDLARTAHGPRHADVAKVEMNLANFLRQRGRKDEALERYNAALEIQRATLDERSLALAITRYNLATLLGDRGEYREACEVYRAVDDVFAEHLPSGHPHRVTVKNALGRSSITSRVTPSAGSPRCGRRWR